MPSHPLFYQSLVPLHRDRHRDWKLAQGEGRHGFAAGSHVIPAVVDEFGAALAHLPIVFAPSEPRPTTVFLVGVRPAQNLFVDADGRWTGGYIPAFVRRYPFMRGEVEGGSAVTCIDERSALLSTDDGEALFDAQGQESPLLRTTMELVESYYQAAQRTERFLDMVQELQLLRNVTIETQMGPGSSALIHGFMTIDEDKLGAIDATDFLRLRDAGFLPAIYAHLYSLRAVDTLRRAVADAAEAAQDDAA